MMWSRFSFPRAMLAMVAGCSVSWLAACGGPEPVAPDAGPGAVRDAAVSDAAVPVDARPVDAGAPADAAIAVDGSFPREGGSGDAGGILGGDDAGGRPFVDLVVQLREFDAYDGVNAHLRAVDTSIWMVHGPASGTIVAGSVDLTIERGFVRDLFGEFGYLWLDVSGDNACTDDVDVAWQFFINNDFGDGPETIEVRPTDLGLEAIDCATAHPD
jgi:hypothetical protein